jgi:hypothetical protein
VLWRKNEKSDGCAKKGLTVDTVSDKLRPRSMEQADGGIERVLKNGQCKKKS